MVSIKISEDDLLRMFMDRFRYWNKDEFELALIRQYYERLIEDKCFENCTIDVKKWVDNEWANMSFITENEFDSYDISNIVCSDIAGNGIRYYLLVE